MNLPIKLVDLVTLLFLSLLVKFIWYFFAKHYKNFWIFSSFSIKNISGRYNNIHYSSAKHKTIQAEKCKGATLSHLQVNTKGKGKYILFLKSVSHFICEFFFYSNIKRTTQDIKEAIIAKHAKSHAYRAPPQLMTFNHMKNSEDSKNFFFVFFVQIYF